MSEIVSSDLKIIRRLFSLARPYWGMLSISYLLSLFRIPLVLLAPVPTMVAVDSVISDKPLPAWLAAITPVSIQESAGALLLLAVCLVVLIAFLTQAQMHGTVLYKTYLGEKLVLDYRSRLFRHAQQLSFAYHDEKGISDSIYRVQNDANSIQGVLVYGLTPIVMASLTLSSLLYVTAQLDFLLAFVALSIAPVFVLLTNYFRKKLRGQWREVKEAETSVLQAIQESLGALRVVKAFGQEEREHGRFVTRSTTGLWARIRATFGQSAYSFASAITISIGTALVLFIGVKHVMADILTIGQLLVVINYVTRMYGPLESIGQQVASLQNSLAGAERTFSLLDHVTEVPEDEHALSLSRARGEIELKHVRFGYDEDGPAVLNDVCLRIPAGQKVGVTGRTGAGKTTLINLLMRFYDVQEGEIYLDGKDIRKYKIKDLRNQFSVVLQEPLLLSATIGENIAYANPNATYSEIVEAAKAANAHEFIQKLTGAYDAQVGERGMSLSGGQRQRISIARAFLKDAPILILDEPTSAIDTETEAEIIDAMNRLAQAKTTFMIAHRTSTLRDCDIAISIENGRVSTSDVKELNSA